MKRVAATVGAALLFGASAAGRSAQVAVTEEPHHRVVLYTAQLRVLDVNISPGDTALDHAHDRDTATVAIGNATTRTRRPGEDWGAPRVRRLGSVNITEYTGAPAVHRVENVDTTPYHLIAVENLRDERWSMPKAPAAAAGTTLIQQSRAFAVYDVRLSAGTPRTTHAHEVPTISVLVAGAFENQGGGGETPFRLQQPGRWLLTPMGQAHTMSVIGAGDAHVIEVEVR